ncbi:hypothetical protein KSAC_20440 [Komagataeibacter saccharivorans]|nr:hypothetical protein KSAC_20440 [Komagataeibacter saccharivorans]
MSNADMPPFLYRHIMRGMQDGYPTAPPVTDFPRLPVQAMTGSR